MEIQELQITEETQIIQVNNPENSYMDRDNDTKYHESHLLRDF